MSQNKNRCRAKNPQTCPYHGNRLPSDTSPKEKSQKTSLSSSEQAPQTSRKKKILPPRRFPPINIENLTFYAPPRDFYLPTHIFNTSRSPKGEMFISEIDSEKVLYSQTGTKNVKIPQAFIDEAKAIGIANVENWEIVKREDTDFDNKEEASYICLLNEEVSEKLIEAYYKLPHAVSSDGILQYCRSKGQWTQGMTPLEAIKSQLRQENNDMRHSLVEDATSATRGKIEIKKVTAPAQHYLERIQPRETVALTEGAPEIDGVVYHHPHSQRYSLIDGYHRYKNLIQKKRVSGNYIILSN